MAKLLKVARCLFADPDLPALLRGFVPEASEADIDTALEFAADYIWLDMGSRDEP